MPGLAGFFVDVETGLANLILMDANGKPHVIPDGSHRPDTSCPCSPVTYRECDASFDLSGAHPQDCPFCGGSGFVIPSSPLFDTDQDIFYLHNRGPKCDEESLSAS